MKRTEKDAFIGELQEKLGDAHAFYLTDFTGLTVKQMTQFRARLRKHGVEYVVVKNTLAQRALEDLDLPDVADFFTGPTGIVIGRDDAVAAAKAITDFAREFGDRPAVKVGVVERREFNPAQVRRLAELPPREVLLAQLATSMRAPTTRLAVGMVELLVRMRCLLELLRRKRELSTQHLDGSPELDAAVTIPAQAASSVLDVEFADAQERSAELQAVASPQRLDPDIMEDLDEIERWTLGAGFHKRENATESLRLGQRYTLELSLGPSSPSSAARSASKQRTSTTAAVVIRGTLLLLSQDVELLGPTPDFDFAKHASGGAMLWSARRQISMSVAAPPRIPQLEIIPRSPSMSQLQVMLLVGDELYRDWVLQMRVGDVSL